MVYCMDGGKGDHEDRSLTEALTSYARQEGTGLRRRVRAGSRCGEDKRTLLTRGLRLIACPVHLGLWAKGAAVCLTMLWQEPESVLHLAQHAPKAW